MSCGRAPVERVPRSGTVVGDSKCTAPNGRMPATPARAGTLCCTNTSSPRARQAGRARSRSPDGVEHGAFVQHAAAHPGDLVGRPALVRPQVAASQVYRVRGVMQVQRCHAGSPGLDQLGAPDGPTTARTVRARPVGGRAGRTGPDSRAHQPAPSSTIASCKRPTAPGSSYTSSSQKSGKETTRPTSRRGARRARGGAGAASCGSACRARRAPAAARRRAGYRRTPARRTDRSPARRTDDPERPGLPGWWRARWAGSGSARARG
jgi:hypothetical protein